MMQTKGSVIDERVGQALTSAERRIHVYLMVAWGGSWSHQLSDLSNFADDIVVDRSLSGSAPSELMLIEGAAAAELTFTLSGEATNQAGKLLSFPAVFSPYNGDSPLYGTNPIGAVVTLQYGVETPYGLYWYPQFVGRVRTIEVDRAEHCVRISALDRAEEMRQPTSLPAWSVSDWHSKRGWTWAQLCNSQWVMHHALLAGDASPTPYRPTHPGESYASNDDPLNVRSPVKFWLSGNGSWLPHVGYPDTQRVQGFPRTEAGGKSITKPYGKAHPDVAVEIASPGNAGRRPHVLNAMANDNTGYSPATSSGFSDDRLKSFFKQYWGETGHYPLQKDEIQSLYDGFAGHCFGFTLVNNGEDATWWRTNAFVPMRIRILENIDVFLEFNSSGQVRARMIRRDTGATLSSTAYMTVPTTPENIDIVAVGIQGYGKTELRLMVNGVTGAKVSIAGYIQIGTHDPQVGLITLDHRVGMQDVFWANRTGLDNYTPSQAAAHCRRPARFAAVLDAGMNQLVSFPTSSYEDAWALVTEVAAAEYGSVWWDETGVFRFWNRDTMLTKQDAPTRTLTLDDANQLTIVNSLDSVRNIITTSATDARAAEDTVVFEASDVDQFYVPAGSVREFTFPAEDVITVVPWMVPRYATVTGTNVPDPWNDSRTHGYVVQFRTGFSGGAEVWQEQDHLSSGVDVFARLNPKNNTLTILIWNGYTVPARLATNSGSPALRIEGGRVNRNDPITTTVRDQSSIDLYGARNLPIEGDWVQNQPGTITSLMERMLERSVEPIPTTDAIDVAGDPRRQLGDVEYLEDPDGFGEEMRLQILGITRSYARGEGLTDTLTVEMIRPPGVGIWDSPQYGRWDTTFKWS